MNISYNWLKQYADFDLSPEEVSTLLTDSGLEVGGIEKVESIKGGLKGIVIGKVLTCEKHPDADKLSKTTVDIGDGKIVPIVCGAPNVAKGQTVAVATVGATLYDGDSEFKIKKAKIRGEVSEGMICAEDELGLGSSHDGIMVLDNNAQSGLAAADYFNIEEDIVFEIDLTPNRSDATAHIGVARDLVAMINNQKSKNLKINRPNVADFKIDEKSLDFEIIIKNPEACARYTALAMSQVEVKDSPKWLKNRLNAIGLKPINNIVDISNFVLHETGHPLHIFDYDKIKSKKVEIKTLAKGVKFKALDEKEYELSENDLMICDSDNPMCIAGVFGGIDSGVSSETKNILIESAYFNPTFVRKTSKRHLLNTDASFRFERGADPNITEYALKRAALLIKELAIANISSEIVDEYPKEIKPWEVELNFEKLNRITGQKIPIAQVKKILTDLEIEIVTESEKSLNLLIPTFKTDVTREIDVIEEVLRIYGYNNIIIDNKLKSSIAHHPKVDNFEIKSKLSEFLVSRGWTEAWNNSLSRLEYYQKSPDFDEAKVVSLLNPLSKDLNVMRMDMVFGLLESVKRNINFKSESLKMFEFGAEYIHDKSNENDDVTKEYIQSNKLGLILTGKRKPENWRAKDENVDFFDLKSVVISILSKFGIENSRIIDENLENSIFDYGLEFKLKGQNISIAKFGRLKQYYNEIFDIEKSIFYANINWDVVLKTINPKTKYSEISKYPEVKRDFSLLLDDEIPYSEIEKIAFKTEKKLLKEVNLFDNYKGKGIPEGKKSYAVSFVLSDNKKTLNDKIIDATMNKLKNAFEKELGAVLR
jgi:phenylalanyl-tRNA synthetase beta chain